MSPANATEIEIAGGDKFQVGKIYDVKLTTGFEFKGIVLAGNDSGNWRFDEYTNGE